MPRFLTAPAGALLMAGLFAACDGGTEPVPDEAVGAYSLVAVSGKSLPAALGPATEQQLTAIRGDLLLRADGEYLQIIRTSYVTSEGNPSTGTNTTGGEFEVEGSRIELREELGATRSGTLDSGEIRYDITVAGVPVALRWQK